MKGRYVAWAGTVHQDSGLGQTSGEDFPKCAPIATRSAFFLSVARTLGYRARPRTREAGGRVLKKGNQGLKLEEITGGASLEGVEPGWDVSSINFDIKALMERAEKLS